MNELNRLRNRLDGLKELSKSVMRRTFEEQKKLLIKYNADEQMYKLGQDSKGSIIRPAYAPMTIRLKKKKGQPTDRVTLRDTGRFHKTLIVTPKDEYLEISSDVEYAKYLFKRYGNDILGIQQEILKEFTQRYIMPRLNEELKKAVK